MDKPIWHTVGMKTKLICHHLARAKHFEARYATPPRPGARQRTDPKWALDRAAYHYERAAAIFVEELKGWTPPTERSKHTRAFFKRKHANGPGKGRHGVTWGRAAVAAARREAEAAAAAAAAAAGEDESE